MNTIDKEGQLKTRREILKSLRKELKRAWHPRTQEVISGLIEAHVQAISFIKKDMYTGKVEIDIESKINGLTHVRQELSYFEKTLEAYFFVRLSLGNFGREED